MKIMLKDLAANPNLLDLLRNGDTKESHTQRQEQAADEYYAALGEEIEQHPIIPARYER